METRCPWSFKLDVLEVQEAQNIVKKKNLIYLFIIRAQKIDITVSIYIFFEELVHLIWLYGHLSKDVLFTGMGWGEGS